MDRMVRVKYQMAVRVRDLLRATPFGGEPAAQLAAAFVEKVSRAEDLLTQQEQGVLASRASTRNRRELRREMLQVPLRHLVRIARGVAADVPGISGGLRPPTTKMGQDAFLARVRAVVQEAERHKEAFVRHGLSEEVLVYLQGAVARYDALTGEGHAALRARTGASAELRETVRELMKLVRQLDGIVMYEYRDRPDLGGAWQSARNVAWPAGSEEVAPAPEEPAA